MANDPRRTQGAGTPSDTTGLGTATELTPEERIRVLGSADPNMLDMSEAALALPSVRDALIRDFLKGVADLRVGYNDGSEPSAGIVPKIDAEAKRLQGIFYGRDPTYPPVTTWNNPAHLGKWLHDTHGFGSGPDDAVYALFMGDANDLVDMMIQHEEGVATDQDVQDKVDALIEDTMNALVGIPPEDG